MLKWLSFFVFTSAFSFALNFNTPSPNTQPLLPQSMGANPEFNFGWHWFMANFRLKSPDGDSFLAGLQVSPLRMTLLPWLQESQAYLGQVALTRQEDGGYYDFFESRLLPNSAGTIRSDPFLVNYNLEKDSYISIQAIKGQAGKQGSRYTITSSFRSQAKRKIHVEMTVEDRSGLLWLGQNGYLTEGPEPTDAYYYFSLPDLKIISGQVIVDNKTYVIERDLEYSGARLGMQYQTHVGNSYWGWDWTPVKITSIDGKILEKPMCFSFAHSRANTNPNSWIPKYSHGAWLKEDGTSVALSPTQNFSLNFLNFAGPYPNQMEVDISVEGMRLGLIIKPLVPGAVFHGVKPYAENPSTVTGWLVDQKGRHRVAGIAFGEHAGYENGSHNFYDLLARPRN